jgi:hypothetical protein
MVVASISGATFEQSIGPSGVSQSIPVLILTAIGYLTLALALGVVTRLYLMRDLWVRVLASTTVRNIAAAANVSSKGTPASALGEGFADRLDVAGF